MSFTLKLADVHLVDFCLTGTISPSDKTNFVLHTHISTGADFSVESLLHVRSFLQRAPRQEVLHGVSRVCGSLGVGTHLLNAMVTVSQVLMSMKMLATASP